MRFGRLDGEYDRLLDHVDGMALGGAAGALQMTSTSAEVIFIACVLLFEYQVGISVGIVTKNPAKNTKESEDIDRWECVLREEDEVKTKQNKQRREEDDSASGRQATMPSGSVFFSTLEVLEASFLQPRDRLLLCCLELLVCDMIICSLFHINLYENSWWFHSQM